MTGKGSVVNRYKASLPLIGKRGTQLDLLLSKHIKIELPVAHNRSLFQGTASVVRLLIRREGKLSEG